MMGARYRVDRDPNHSCDGICAVWLFHPEEQYDSWHDEIMICGGIQGSYWAQRIADALNLYEAVVEARDPLVTTFSPPPLTGKTDMVG